MDGGVWEGGVWVERIPVGCVCACAPSGWVWSGQQYVFARSFEPKGGHWNSAICARTLCACWVLADGRLVFFVARPCYGGYLLVRLGVTAWRGAKQGASEVVVHQDRMTGRRTAAAINQSINQLRGVGGDRPGVCLAAAVTIMLFPLNKV